MSLLSRRCIAGNSEYLENLIKNELTERQKCYIIKYYRDGETVRSIAQQQGVCPPTVSRTIRRGMAKLMKTAEAARRLRS